MPRSDLTDVFAALGTVVLEPAGGAQFKLLTAPAAWLQTLSTPSPAEAGLLVLRDDSAYLQHFLLDAREFWDRAVAGRLRSGPWIESGTAPETGALEAEALWHNGHAFLLITHLAEAYEEKVRLLQSAREHLLSEERLEREVRRRTAAIRQREEEIAIRLLGAARRRDEETGSHVRRIGLYSAALGTALGWDASRVDDIRVSAPMHDIGKIGIPDAILLKPGRLTPDEYRIMQQHTVIGAAMLGGSDVPLLNMGCEIALCHHEKWDGSGYPHGLRGEQIPIAGRIVAIVDVYDAMVHRRIYKDPIPEVEVLRTMADGAGRHFDPELFALFLSIMPGIRGIRGTVQD
jgi:response regulator RpfG family c-di-GMP phosphodiesterase